MTSSGPRSRCCKAFLVVALPLLFLTACAPRIVLTPSIPTHNFGNVLVGTSSPASPQVTWTNVTTPLKVDNIEVGPEPPFAAVRPGPPMPIHLGTGAATPAFTFQFSPKAVGVARGAATPYSLQIVRPDEAQPVTLFGTGIAQLSSGSLSVVGGQLTPGQVLDFGRVLVPGGAPVTRTFMVKNSGSTQVLLSVTFGAGGGPFTVTSPATSPIPVPPGGSVDVVITFVPPAVGRFVNAVFFIDNNAAINSAATALTGEGAPGG